MATLAYLMLSERGTPNMPGPTSASTRQYWIKVCAAFSCDARWWTGKHGMEAWNARRTFVIDFLRRLAELLPP